MAAIVWWAPTHRDALVRDHGLPATDNPTVTCACGRRVLADVCVDLTPLPGAVRAALGLEGVDYICDSCRTALHVHRYLTCEMLCRMLGAPDSVLAEARGNDTEHALGMRRRDRAYRAQHSPVSLSGVSPGVSPGAAVVEGGARVPHLSGRVSTHALSARALGLVPPRDRPGPGAP